MLGQVGGRRVLRMILGDVESMEILAPAFFNEAMIDGFGTSDLDGNVQSQAY